MLGRYKQFRNLMIRFKILIVFRLIGLIALGLGIKTMLQAPTLILAPQFLVLLCTPILIVVSLAVGFGLKRGLKSSWHTITFTATLETLVCGIFYFSLHRSNEQIEIQLDTKVKST
jgi:hypothetical protein